jgi:hypothetical protein
MSSAHCCCYQPSETPLWPPNIANYKCLAENVERLSICKGPIALGSARLLDCQWHASICFPLSKSRSSCMLLSYLHDLVLPTRQRRRVEVLRFSQHCLLSKKHGAVGGSRFRMVNCRRQHIMDRQPSAEQSILRHVSTLWCIYATSRERITPKCCAAIYGDLNVASLLTQV